MDDFMEPVGIIVVYLLVVGYLPRVMEHRKAWGLRWLIVPYNVSCAAVSAYMVIVACTKMYQEGYGLICGLEDGKPTTDVLFRMHYLFFMTKMIELLDTIFFILRKKNSQVTFLHVYHHASTPLLMWAAPQQYTRQSSFMPGVMFAIMNSAVHTVMYLYYALSAMGPQMKKYLWWKRYITTLQLTQFVFTMLYTLLNMYICQYELNTCYVMIVGTTPHLILFINFYYQNYIKPRPSPEQQPIANGGYHVVADTKDVIEETIQGNMHHQNGMRRRTHNGHAVL